MRKIQYLLKRVKWVNLMNLIPSTGLLYMFFFERMEHIYSVHKDSLSLTTPHRDLKHPSSTPERLLNKR